MVARTASAA